MSKLTVTGTVTNVKRLGTSVNGNPKHEITLLLDNGNFEAWRTEVDGSVNYVITNYAPRSDRANPRVTLTLTRSGRVVDITPA